ncbi:hypothetical protein FGO68_gene4869 [Halteria grandinella]|uniref:Uncharacterized protein n=1 Tax=Halteria grandinella TaxID=5974 RepID=A0A8J8P4M4_HALGN|nr:hypothetical protein FGO68_gene4869 [Halteria grandinella]
MSCFSGTSSIFESDVASIQCWDQSLQVPLYWITVNNQGSALFQEKALISAANPQTFSSATSSSLLYSTGSSNSSSALNSFSERSLSSCCLKSF